MPIPQGLPCDPQCTRPRCGERLEYLATEQFLLYRAGTNGQPVQQDYTLTGSASIGPPKGKHQGEGPEPTTRTPPHSPQTGRPRHGTRGTPPQAPRKRDRGGRSRKGGSGRTHHQRTPARGGGKPHSRDGRGATTHSPHTHTEPPNEAQKGKDRHPNAPLTHCRNAHACTQHTPPQPRPTRAPQPHTTHQSASTARPHHERTQHTKNQGTRTQQPPARGAAGPPGTPLGHKGGPTKPSARSGERPHPATPNNPRPNPGPGTTTPTPAPPPTPKPDATTPSPTETPGTNGDTFGNTSDPSTQQNT